MRSPQKRRGRRATDPPLRTLTAPRRKTSPDTSSVWLSLLQAWRNLLDPGLCRSVDVEPHTSFAGYRWIRRWSPALAPALLGSLLLTVALLYVRYTAHTIGALRGHTLLVTPQVMNLFIAYILCGAAMAVMLFLAPNVVYWLAALVVGVGLLATAMADALAGPWAGLIVAALSLGVALLYTQMRQVLLPAGAVTVTRVFDGSYRMLTEGYHMLLPGERPLVSFQTGEHIYTAPTQRVMLGTSAIGEDGAASGAQEWEARAAATVAYQVIPREAHRLTSVAADDTTGAETAWELALHRVVVVALRDGLADWSAQALATGGVTPEGALARRVLGAARAWARPLGVQILWARVHNIAIGPAEEQLADTSGFPQDAHSPQDITYPTPLAPVEVPAQAQPITAVASVTPVTSAVSAFPPGMVETTLDLGTAHRADGSARVGTATSSATMSSVSSPIQTRLPLAPAASSSTTGAPPPAPVAPVAPLAGVNTASDGSSGGAQRPLGYSAALPSADALADLYDAVREQRISDPTTIRSIAAGFAHVAEQQRVGADTDIDFDAEAAAQLLFSYADQIEQGGQYSQPLS